MTEIKRIGERIATQDNRCTDVPLFVVQEKVRDYGYHSDYSDDYVWRNAEDFEDLPDGDKVVELEGLDDNYEDTSPWEKCHYRERWEFVTACFTEQGCKDFLALDGHNHGETRIYAYGSYRNNEFRTVRQFLRQLAPSEDAQS